MTIFEYLATAASIVLALSVSRLIAASSHVFSVPGRDWLFVSFFLQIFLTNLLVWWNLWELHTIQAWTFPLFLLFIGSPLTLYFTSHLVLDKEPEKVKDWRVQFEKKRVPMFVTLVLVNVIGTIRHYVSVGEFVAPSVVFFLALGSGALISNRNYLWVLTAVLWVTLLYFLSGLFFVPFTVTTSG